MAKRKYKLIKRRTFTSSRKNSGGKAKFFLLIVISAIIVFWSYRIYVKPAIIKSIEITGAKNVSMAEIIVLLPFKVGDIVEVSELKQAELNIKKVKPELANVSVAKSKISANKINIKIREEVPEAFIRAGNNVVGVNFNGKRFRLRGDMKSTKAPFAIFNNDKELKVILEFIKAVKKEDPKFWTQISNVKAAESQNFVLTAEDNTLIYWGEADFDNLKSKLNVFKKVFADAKSKNKAIDYIDMTLYITDRVIVKPSNR